VHLDIRASVPHHNMKAVELVVVLVAVDGLLIEHVGHYLGFHGDLLRHELIHVLLACKQEVVYVAVATKDRQVVALLHSLTGRFSPHTVDLAERHGRHVGLILAVDRVGRAVEGLKGHHGHQRRCLDQGLVNALEHIVVTKFGCVSQCHSHGF